MAENTLDQLRTDMLELGAAARSAATILSKTSSNTKNKALMAAADEIRKRQAIILQANRTDMEATQNLDFSKINIKNIEINKAGNDCLDFSSGKYEILNMNLVF